MSLALSEPFSAHLIIARTVVAESFTFVETIGTLTTTSTWLAQMTWKV